MKAKVGKGCVWKCASCTIVLQLAECTRQRLACLDLLQVAFSAYLSCTCTGISNKAGSRGHGALRSCCCYNILASKPILDMFAGGSLVCNVQQRCLGLEAAFDVERFFQQALRGAMQQGKCTVDSLSSWQPVYSNTLLNMVCLVNFSVSCSKD